MDINLSPEEQTFQKEVQAFIEDNYTKVSLRGMEKYLHWIKALVEKGWQVPKWPKEHGGTGWSVVQHYIWQKETSIAGTPPTGNFGVNMIGPILYTYGTPEQQEKHLPSIRDFSINWCQGYSEPGAGSDLASLKTKAALSEDGSHYLVNGQKIWTSLAHMAQWMFCLTRTDASGKKQDGITFLLIDMNDPGIEVKPIITLGGHHSVNSVFISDVKVPVENRIGEENVGWTYAKGLLQHERTGLAGITSSAMALEKLKADVLDIGNGDKSMADDAAFKAKAARLEIDIMALSFLELQTMLTVAEGKAPGPESSILKLMGTKAQQSVAELSMDTAAYYGSPWGKSKVDKLSRGAMSKYLIGRASTIYGGASEVQRDVIAKKVLGL